MKKKDSKSGTKTNRILVRIDADTALKLSKLGWMHEIPLDVIKKLVDHAHVCDRWLLERDEEDEL